MNSQDFNKNDDCEFTQTINHQEFMYQEDGVGYQVNNIGVINSQNFADLPYFVKIEDY